MTSKQFDALRHFTFTLQDFLFAAANLTEAAQAFLAEAGKGSPTLEKLTTRLKEANANYIGEITTEADVPLLLMQLPTLADRVDQLPYALDVVSHTLKKIKEGE